jgi:cytochrome c-type biogenesis protein
MIADIFSDAARSIALRSCFAPLFTLAAGALSSLGPCTAPRLLAVVSCTGSARRAPLRVWSFCGGLITGYATLGLSTSLIARLIDIATWTYAALACALLAGGISTLVHADSSTHEHAHDTKGKTDANLGATFLLGASFAFVIAPCCTPLVATIAAYTAESGDPSYGAAMLALFALGHSLPIVLAGSSSTAFARILRAAASHQIAAIVSGTLMLALSAFYWCLA